MQKQLYRSNTNRVLGGVCGGIGEYFNIDPVLIRLAFVIAIFGFGMSLIVYPILWLVIPPKN